MRLDFYFLVLLCEAIRQLLHEMLSLLDLPRPLTTPPVHPRFSYLPSPCRHPGPRVLCYILPCSQSTALQTAPV